MVEVIMPKMGDAMEEGILVEWLAEEGDKVKSGDTIGNIQTDKATVELTAPSTGTLSGVISKAGDTVPVGVPIAAILKDGESLPDGWGGGASSKVAPTKVEEPAPAEAVASKPKEEAAALKQAEPAEAPREAVAASAAPKAGGRVFASPLARRLAEDAGLPLEDLAGSGPNGRIVERDVRAALPKPKPAGIAAIATSDRMVDLTNLQRIVAERTAHSKLNVPHYYVTVEVDVEALEALREQMNEENQEGKLSINDFIIKACAFALQEQPHINASFENGKRHEYGQINIGVAAAVPDGLTLPVIKDCGNKSLRQIAVEVRDLVGKAKENKLSLDQLTGSTFAISNMGMFDVENFSAIINEPNGAIVAVSTAGKVPVVVETEDGDDIEIRSRMKITGSFDHRIIDGAVGAEFMGVLRTYLEAPTRLLS
ncbi:MAG: 2-oxo acid dehydrogenase subunit E2 [Armatimonadetes bacterium]|nr:2-oxo acid dehydrogenase subunit E2 [Armatimonadota bacterium]